MIGLIQNFTNHFSFCSGYLATAMADAMQQAAFAVFSGRH